MSKIYTRDILPAEGYVRLGTVLQVIPVSRSTWYTGMKDGRFPMPEKLGRRISAWDVKKIRALMDKEQA